MEAPEHHQDRIDRESREGDRQEAKARQKKLIEKYGEASTEVEDDRNKGQFHEVEGADCPECENGVVVVFPDHSTYPPWREECTSCGGDIDL
jgi:ribosomal protein S27E